MSESFTISREQFGRFLSERRKELGFTQKTLAEKLFVSDKAVSKWERGLSLPDVSLLIPLSELLDVSVTELLEGRRIDTQAEIGAAQTETLVRKALESVRESDPKRRKKSGLQWGFCLAVAALELAFGAWHLSSKGIRLSSTFVPVFEALSAFLGTYVWIGLAERLPAFYDEYQVPFYWDGIFRLQLPGAAFHNGNWPRVVRVLRCWAAGSLLVVPLLCFLPSILLTDQTSGIGVFSSVFLLIAYLGSLFLPLWQAARKK